MDWADIYIEDMQQEHNAEISKLREALRWYAKMGKSVGGLIYLKGHPDLMALKEDGGKRAREALGDE